MENAEFNNVYAIPANYTDSGKLLGGMLETRNAVETVALVILVGYPELFLFSMPAMIRLRFSNSSPVWMPREEK